MNQKNMDKWGSLRLKGKKHFVIRYGILGWGLSFAVLSYALQYLTGNVKHFFLDAIIYLILSFIGGCVWGLIVWNSMERQYRNKLS
jgi:hypothetical protein